MKIKKNVLEILKDPDSRLRAPNSNIDNSAFGLPWLIELSRDMLHTVRAVRGLGLAAPQIGQNLRMTVVLIDKIPVVMINPVVLSKAEKMIEIGEGCLSCPGAEIRIPRPEWIEVQFNSINGKENIRIFGGMNAIIVAHELDHLEGKLITYYVSSLGQEKSKWIIDAHIL